jgi:hypothetical protein
MSDHVVASDAIGRLRKAIAVARCKPATSEAWGAAEEALEAALSAGHAMEALLAAGLNQDDLDCQRFEEIHRAIGYRRKGERGQSPRQN